MSASRTPADLHIERRSPHFDLDDALGRDWHGGDPFRTAWFNAFSVTFPTGERFFIDAVRAFVDDIADPVLAGQMQAFIGQEATHGREHRAYNERLCALRGYDLERMEAAQVARIEWMKRNTSRYQWLAATVALEHVTALMADGILGNPAWLDGAEPAMAALWRWHAVEETEHKAVAFDVYRAAGGWDETRRKILTVVTWHLLRDTLSHTRHMLGVAGLAGNAGLWWRGMGFLFGPRGIWRPLLPDWRRFRRPDFHPWDHDNRVLIERWVNACS